MTGRARLVDRLLGRRARLQLARVPGSAVATAVLAAGGVVAAIVLIAALRVGLPWQERYVTQVAVTDASGIVPHSGSVRISGVPVGTVEAVDIRAGQPVLTIEMDSDKGPLYRDARARIRPATPLNDMYLDVTFRGTPGAGILGRDDVLAPRRTAQPVDISRVLNVFDADVRPRMRALIVSLGEALHENGDDFQRTLVELAPFLRAGKRLSDQVARRSAQMKRLVHNFDAMTGELARRDTQLSSLLEAAGETFDELGDRSSPLARLFIELPQTLREVPRSFEVLRAAAGKLDPALEALRPTARSLPRGLSALAGLAPDLRSGADALGTTVAPLRKLLRDTTPLAGDLTKAFTTLTPQLPRLEGIGDQIKPCQKALNAYLHYWLSVYKLYDDVGVLDHAQSNYATSSAGTPDLFLKAVPGCTGLDPTAG